MKKGRRTTAGLKPNNNSIILMHSQNQMAASHARRITWIRAREISLMAQLEDYTAGRTDRRPRCGVADWLKVRRDSINGGLVLAAYCPNEILPHVKALARDLEASLTRATGKTIQVAVIQVKPYTGRSGLK